MAGKSNLTAPYRIITDAGGNRYRFFCALSGAAMCTTQPVLGDTQEEELALAWDNEGKQHFNMCHRCGAWVCDAMYNADVCECVDCAPWEERPHFCSQCGEPVPSTNLYCEKCGAKLQYKEVSQAC